jgi:hypothetical protein
VAILQFEQPKEQIGDLLAKGLGENYIGATTARIRGWSSISNYMICDRMFYYKTVKKYRKVEPSPALDIGILFHECLAAHYSTGGQRTFEPLNACAESRPEIAHEVKRLLYAYFGAYLKEDAETWDVRAVETEIIGDITYGSSTAKVYSRLDLLVRKKTKDQPVDPFGPCPDGVYLVDHKVMARITRDLEEGYKMDGQFLLMGLLWHKNKLDEVYGPLKGFIINIVSKTKDVGLKRLVVNIQQEDYDRFEHTMAPTIVELHNRLASEDEKASEENWPMNFSVCKSPKGYGPCEYLDLCMSHGKMDKLYQIGSRK